MPFPEVTPHFAPAALEERALTRWRELDLIARVDELRANGVVWSFYEGPPTANGRPGVHHVWARGFKDLYMRFRSMQGNRVPRKGGWDCHGLPVEIEVEKELGLSSKQEIEQFGISEFNERCRQSVQRYVGDWKALTQRAGIWIDTDDVYWTSLGADALRWFFFSQGQPWTPRRISHEAIRTSSSETLVTLWNVYSFFTTYANLDQWEPTDSRRPARHVLDTWILSELDDTVSSVTRSLSSFDSYDSARRLAKFVDDLSNWYIRRSRGRFWRGSEPGAYATLHECLVTMSQLIAPFCPMLADELYLGLTSQTSVHLTDWPADRGRYDPALAEQMASVRRLAALGRAARVEVGVKVRQPLRRALLIHPGDGFGVELLEELKAELNVKEIERIEVVSEVTDWQCVPNFRVLGPRLGAKMTSLRKELSESDGSRLKADMDRDGFVEVGGERLTPYDVEFRPVRRAGIALASDGEWATALDLVITPELLAEGVARDLIRSLNDFRKLENFGISDKVNVVLDMPEQLRTEIGPHWEWITSEILAANLSFGSGGTEFDLNGHSVRVQLTSAEGKPE